MSTAPSPDQAATEAVADVVRAPFDRLTAAWRAGTPPTLGERHSMLEGIARWTIANKTGICEAIDADFGGRSHHDTLIADVWVCVSNIRHTQKHLRQWMRPQRRPMYWVLRPATGKVHRVPVGVVGVIGPWNYPFQLCVVPLVTALAAGNKVLLKPSELTPKTGALLERMIAEVLPPDQVAVVQGGPDVGAAFSALPFDHLFFTGSTGVGRKVAVAAAANLTPCTLELGGKAPAIVHESYDITRAANSIAWGKLFNGGQTCIAIDHVMVHPSRRDELVEALRAAVVAQFPTLQDNADYTATLTERHLTRLRQLVADAEAKGARVVYLHPEGESPQATKMPPVALLDCTPDMRVMQEEIFGPILPVLTVETTDDAIRQVNAGDPPLAVYVFDDNTSRAESVMLRIPCGGGVINDPLIHYGVEDLPFGGFRTSGIGAYHGERGFLTFSHEKSVVTQSRLNGAALIRPPYGAMVERLLKVVIR
jgi:acyl-CoA reductase-like NAD-dependent aldehyde dehydrogenase